LELLGLGLGDRVRARVPKQTAELSSALRSVEKHFHEKSAELQIPPLRSPEFPVKLDGVVAIHAPFFTEGRTRGLLQCCVAGNPGTLRSG
jgi:hypothetical protein